MDPPIKLFGQTIAKVALSAFTASSGEGKAEAVSTTSSGVWGDLPSSSQEVKDTVPESSGVVEISGSGVTCTRQDPKAGSIPDLTSSASNSAEEEKCCESPPGGAGGSGAADENRSRHLTPPVSQGDGGGGDDENSEEDDGSQVNERGKKDGGGDNDMGKGGEKIPRRPENAVACPRCHSLETKFCYYNNYNVNQPRHFCKHCQRYWTAGGTLRNVPVGAGRRKNKHGSTIAPRGQTPEVGTVRSDAPDIASPLLVTKGVVSMPIQVSVVHGTGGKAGVMRMAVPATSDPSVLPFLRMQTQQIDPASVFVTSSEAGMLSDTGTVACKRSRIATAGYSEASIGANDMDQQQSQGAWGQAASTGRDETACSPVASSNNMNGHEMKEEAGPGRPMMAVAASPVPIPLGGGGPEQTQHPGTNNTTVVAGVWSGAGPQATGPPPGAAAGPFGFYNGGWPYGFNVGWSGPAAFCAGGVAPGGTAVGGPPPPGNIAAAWNGSTGSVWAGVPWPMPGLAWGPPWPMAPWAMTPGPGGTQTISMGSAGVHTAPAPGSTTPAAAAPPPSGVPPSSPSSSLGKHPRAGPPSGAVACNGAGAPGGGGGGRGKKEGNGGLWAPKSLRMADPEEAIRSSVWRILGVGTRPDMTTGSTFKAFHSRNESKKVSDDDQQVAQASLHANPAAMSRSMNFHESNY